MNWHCRRPSNVDWGGDARTYCISENTGPSKGTSLIPLEAVAGAALGRHAIRRGCAFTTLVAFSPCFSDCRRGVWEVFGRRLVPLNAFGRSGGELHLGLCQNDGPIAGCEALEELFLPYTRDGRARQSTAGFGSC